MGTKTINLLIDLDPIIHVYNLYKIKNGKIMKLFYSSSIHYYTKWELIDSFPDFEWDWSHISNQYNVEWNIIKKLCHKEWKWLFLSKREDIPWDFVSKTLYTINWNNYQLSRNPSLTMEFVIAHRRYNWIEPIILHRFDFDKYAIKIQRWWRDEKYYNPNSQVCKNRLLREFKELMQEL
jgi:hypothetical protein